MRSRYRLVVAYDGSGFHGFAPNPGVRTVAGVLTEALSPMLGTPVSLTCAGRTDAGVHAWGQVVHFDGPSGVDTERLRDACNKMCGPAVVVREACVVAGDFDARRDATSRVYRYSVLSGRVPDPFRAHLSWHQPEPLDITAMNEAARHFVGEHDFASFCRRRTARLPTGDRIEGSTVRRVLRAVWSEQPDELLRFEIEATAFCHQMVRSITGTLVAVGRGRMPGASLPAVLAARDRHAAGPVAPPHGLCLWAVRYGGGPPVADGVPDPLS